ncbi:Hypothetical predicted protein [Olea europaea subsp. europaea]|uniref:Uncharacterized protein n=1 Tax=Olea europaea subsp. europaea TaxID=158383 RepID=A0A8S0TFE1_OLEEU|nr:Hypothetical predicted protein [Olea europaea subsp. europaea]
MPAKRKPPHPISVTTPRTQLNTITSTLLEPIMSPATATVRQRHHSNVGIMVVLVA